MGLCMPHLLSKKPVCLQIGLLTKSKQQCQNLENVPLKPLMFLILGDIQREPLRRKTSPVETSCEPVEATARDPPSPSRSNSKSAPPRVKPKKSIEKTPHRFSISNLFTWSKGSEKRNHISVSSIPGAFICPSIWGTSPSLHTGQKLVTFWGSLSHFCAQILNGTI